MRKMTFIGLMVFGAFGWTASADILPGPLLGSNEIGYFDHGIQFKALTNSILTGFDFNYQGGADTVELTTPMHTTILDSLSIPSASMSPAVFTASVNWALTAGNTYWLIAITKSNGRFAPFPNSSFPVSDADISVISGVFADDTTSVGANNWGDFRNLRTGSSGSPVPEPGTLVLLATAAVLVGVCRLRTKMPATRAGVPPYHEQPPEIQDNRALTPARRT